MRLLATALLVALLPARPAVASGDPLPCKAGVYFADRSAGGAYRVLLQGDKKPPAPENRLVLTVVTSHGAWQLPEMRLGQFFNVQELTIPDDGDVRAAWIDAEGGPGETMHACAPTMAFLPEGVDGVPKTKKELREQWAGGYLAKHMTHIHVIPGVLVHNTGKPAQGAIAIAEPPCTAPLGEAAGPLVRTAANDTGPALVVNVSPAGRVMTADIIRSFGSRALDEARLADAAMETFATPPSTGCLAVPHRATLTTP